MDVADKTYEKAPGGAPPTGLESYTVLDERGEPVGRVLSVTEDDGRIELVVAQGAPPFSGSPAVVPWEAVQAVDHEQLTLTVRRAAVGGLDPDQVVETPDDADARHVEEMPGGVPAPTPPDQAFTRSRPMLLEAWGLAIVSVLLVFPVIAWAAAADSLWLLLLLILPLGGIAVAAVAILRALRAPYVSS